MKMTIITWQLIAATCCLLLKTGLVLSQTFGAPGQTDYPISGPKSYSSDLDYERKAYPSSFRPYSSATDPLLYAGVSEVGNFPATQFDSTVLRQQQPQHQPKVYQSTVSRPIGPARQASNEQASTTTLGDLNMAAGHHHGYHHHGKYYEYREVPKKNTWKFGYKRGNLKHHIERHEQGQAGKHPHFKTKVKWADKKSKGKGIHLWDYNHHDKKHYHHHGK